MRLNVYMDLTWFIGKSSNSITMAITDGGERSDLKPENILIDYNGHIALCDFGLCKLNMTETKRTNTFCGTPEYLAPELLLGQGYTKNVDWWTLGVLLYEMLTGLPPFYDENTNEMYRKILQDELRFPDDMSDAAQSLLRGVRTNKRIEIR